MWSSDLPTLCFASSPFNLHGMPSFLVFSLDCEFQTFMSGNFLVQSCRSLALNSFYCITLNARRTSCYLIKQIRDSNVESLVKNGSQTGLIDRLFILLPDSLINKEESPISDKITGTSEPVPRWHGCRVNLGPGESCSQCARFPSSFSFETWRPSWSDFVSTENVQFFQVSFFSLAKRGFGIDVMPTPSTSRTRRLLKVLHGLENGLSAWKKTLLVREIFSVRSGDSWRIWKSPFLHTLTLKPGSKPAPQLKVSGFVIASFAILLEAKII